MIDEASGIGESDNTPIKNETVTALFSAWCRVVASICERVPRRVLLVDLTAGDGYTRGRGPTFLSGARSMARNAGLDTEIYAFEERRDNADRLQSSGFADVVVCGPWQDHLELIQNVTSNAFAFVYHDPNRGYQKEHEAILDLAMECPKVDLCLHMDANQILRIRNAGFHCVTIDRIVSARPHCLIRREYGVGAKWTVIYLSNCAIKGYAKYGFFDLQASETGRQLLRRMSTTKAERKRSPGQRMLFE